MKVINILLLYSPSCKIYFSNILKINHNLDVLKGEECCGVYKSVDRKFFVNKDTAQENLKKGIYDIIICFDFLHLTDFKQYNIPTIFIIQDLYTNSPSSFYYKANKHYFNVSSNESVHRFENIFLTFSSKEVKDSWKTQGEVVDISDIDFLDQWDYILAKSLSVNRELDKKTLNEISKSGNSDDYIIIESCSQPSLKVCVFLYPIFAVDCIYILRELGFDVVAIPMGINAWDKLELSSLKILSNFRPHFCLSINFYPSLAKTLKRLNLLYVSWLTDPVIDECIKNLKETDDNSFIFSFSRKEMVQFKHKGFKNVFYLPLAANTQRNRPRLVSEESRLKYNSNISFLGDSITSNDYSLKLLSLIEKLKASPETTSKKDIVDQIVKYEEIIATQCKTNNYILPDILKDSKVKKNTSHVFNEIDSEYREENFLADISKEASSRKRKEVINSLGTLGVNLYGDVYWKFMENDSIKYVNIVKNFYEIPLIYNTSKINLNISRVYHDDMVIMRVFDILACKGFLLTDYKKALEEFFIIGKDLICYNTSKDAYNLAKYFLKHPAKRAEIANNGYRKVIENHSIKNRLISILEKIKVLPEPMCNKIK